MSIMKVETFDIRTIMHNLLFQWMEYIIVKTAAGGNKMWLCQVISEYSINLLKKKYVFWLILFKNICA